MLNFTKEELEVLLYLVSKDLKRMTDPQNFKFNKDVKPTTSALNKLKEASNG